MKFSKDEKWVLGALTLLFPAGVALGWRLGGTVGALLILSLAIVLTITVIIGGFRQQRENLEARYRDTEALFNLHGLLKTRAPLPALGGHALSPQRAVKLISLVLEKKPEHIVEFGSGVSTVLLAYTLQGLERGRIISFEHEERYAAITRENLARHGLSQFATVIYAPLEQRLVNKDSWSWYGIKEQDIPENIDLMLVDGPPRKTQPLARYPALPVMYKHMANSCNVILDDAARADEQEIATRWLQQFPDFSRHEDASEPNLLVLAKG